MGIYMWRDLITTPWIYHNPTLWLISLSSDGSNWMTIADKNLGATNTDITNSDSYWNYYQWWNNYWFVYWWTPTTSSSTVNASTYWPWNYYSSDTFITRWSSPYRWDTTDNWNLWWWVTGVMPTSLKNAYIGGDYEYSYDFRNKTIGGIVADGWTYDNTKVPSFDSNWIYYSAVNTTTPIGIEFNRNLASAKKITLNVSFVITDSTTHLWTWGIAPTSWTGFSWIALMNILGAHNQEIRINGSSVTTTNVNLSTWTYTSTIEYDLINKTYAYTGSYPISWTLTDEQISWIKTCDEISASVGAGGIRISTVNLTIEY